MNMTDLSIKLMEVSPDDCENIIIEKLNQVLDQALEDSNKFYWPKLRNIIKDITLNLKERTVTNERNQDFLIINKKIEQLEVQYNSFFKRLFNEPHKLEKEALKRQNNKYFNEEDLLKKMKSQNQSFSLIYGLDCSDSCSSNILNKTILHKSDKVSETVTSNSSQIYKNVGYEICISEKDNDNVELSRVQNETQEHESVFESSKSISDNEHSKNNNAMEIETQPTQEKSFGNLELGEFPCTQTQGEFVTQSPEFGFISAEAVTKKENEQSENDQTIDESCSLNNPSMDFIVYPI